MAEKVTVQPFGEFEGRMVNKYTITQVPGIQVSVINYGAAVTSILVPDRTGSPADVVLGFDTLDGYIRSGQFYIGGICGRYANRIANARFHINGNNYQLSNNIGFACLHGGFRGFDKKYWEAAILPEENGIRFSYLSKDGEEGFPGNLEAAVTYRVVDNSLQVEYSAITDKATPVNLTSHSYFNLSGGKDDTILAHELQIHADRIVEVTEGYVPTGRMLEIVNSPLDFNTPKKITGPNGKEEVYDYSWVVKKGDRELAEAVSLIHRPSGRKMVVYTTQPAVHFYSGHFLEGDMKDSKYNKVYGKYAGLCLETQHFPDSPNHPDFPNTIIKPGETYSEKTIYRFETIMNKIN